MWNSVEKIAVARRIDRDGLVKFSLENKERFAIEINNGTPTVSPWYSSDLVNAYKKAAPEACNLPYAPLPNLTTIVHYAPQ